MSQASRAGSGSVSNGGSTVDPQPRHRLKLGLLAKTILALLVVGFFPLLAFGLFTLAEQRTSLDTMTEKSLQNTAEQISAQVDEWFDKNVRGLRATVNMLALTSMQRADQTPVLLAFKQAYPWMYLVHTIGLDGRNVARSDDQPLADYSDRQYLKDIRDGGKDLAWLTAIGKTSGKPALSIAVPIRAHGTLLGVLVAAMTIEEASTIVANWRSGQTGFAFLVDEKAKVLAHPRRDFVLTQKALSTHPLVAAYQADHKPHLQSFTDDGLDNLGYVHGNSAGWAVVVQQSRDELFAPLRSTATIGALLLLGAIVLVVGLGISTSRLLVRPIAALTSAADRMSLGEMGAPVVSQGNDELTVLARSLERVRRSMVVAMKRIDSQLHS